MKNDELFNRMKNNSIGNEKRIQKEFTRKKIALNASLSVILSVVLAFSVIGCAKKDEAPFSNTNIEYSQIYEDYGYSKLELKNYGLDRLDNILEDNGLIEYTRDEDGLRDYHYNAEDYRNIDGLDDSYMYAFYYRCNDKSVEEFSIALGYDSFNDFLIKHDYLKENGDIDISKWHKEYFVELAKIKSMEENNKGMSL